MQHQFRQKILHVRRRPIILDGWFGDMLELQVYNKAFEANELTIVSNQLMAKWGVTPRL